MNQQTLGAIFFGLVRDLKWSPINVHRVDSSWSHKHTWIPRSPSQAFFLLRIPKGGVHGQVIPKVCWNCCAEKKHNERKGQQKTKIQVKYWSSLLKIQIFMSEYDGGPNVYIYIERERKHTWYIYIVYFYHSHEMWFCQKICGGHLRACHFCCAEKHHAEKK